MHIKHACGAIRYCFALLPAIVLSGHSAPSVQKDVLVVSFHDSNPNNYDQLQNASFFVRSDQVLKTNEWKPGLESFPLNVGDAAKWAHDNAVGSGQITNDVSLEQISISRFYANLSDETTGPGDLGNHWFAAFQYLVHNYPNFTLKYSVTLLNGSHAIEQPSALENFSFEKPMRTSHPPPLLLGGEKSPDNSTTGHFLKKFSPYTILESPDFKIPSIRWNPLADNFPMDLNLASIQSADYLTQKLAVTNVSLVLDEITIDNFIPTGAIQAQHLDFGANLNNWMLAFRYYRPDDNDKSKFSVYMLLDGQIFGASEN